MIKNFCRFTNLSHMASFCAELTAKGIAFHSYPTGTGDEYIVEITGY
jgi:hypothetical protein